MRSLTLFIALAVLWTCLLVHPSNASSSSNPDETTIHFIFRGLPKFEEYPAPEDQKFKGTIASQLKWDKKLEPLSSAPEKMKQRFNEALQSGPDFAGKYKVVPYAYGCGTGCSRGRILNVETGEILEDSFDATAGVLHQKDSRMLITGLSEGNITNLSEPRGPVSYYVLVDDKLILMETITAKRTVEDGYDHFYDHFHH